MNLEERILNIAEAPAWFDSRELRAIALEVRKREDRIKQLEDRIQRLEDGDAALTYSIGLDLQKENEALKARIKRLEEAAMMALHGCYNGPMPDHVGDAIADAMEAKP